jgi:hypothetical protein
LSAQQVETIDNSKLYYASFLTFALQKHKNATIRRAKYETKYVTIINDENTLAKINLRRACRLRIIQAINRHTSDERTQITRSFFPSLVVYCAAFTFSIAQKRR